jgi:hypothetical protein
MPYVVYASHDCHFLLNHPRQAISGFRDLSRHSPKQRKQIPTRHGRVSREYSIRHPGRNHPACRQPAPRQSPSRRLATGKSPDGLVHVHRTLLEHRIADCCIAITVDQLSHQVIEYQAINSRPRPDALFGKVTIGATKESLVDVVAGDLIACKKHHSPFAATPAGDG